jgi:hypothetical protein
MREREENLVGIAKERRTLQAQTGKNGVLRWSF